MTLDQLQQHYKVIVNATKPIVSPGLSDAEVKERIEKFGLNQLSPPKKKHTIIIY